MSPERRRRTSRLAWNRARLAADEFTDGKYLTADEFRQNCRAAIDLDLRWFARQDARNAKRRAAAEDVR